MTRLGAWRKPAGLISLYRTAVGYLCHWQMPALYRKGCPTAANASAFLSPISAPQRPINFVDFDAALAAPAWFGLPEIEMRDDVLRGNAIETLSASWSRAASRNAKPSMGNRTSRRRQCPFRLSVNARYDGNATQLGARGRVSSTPRGETSVELPVRALSSLRSDETLGPMIISAGLHSVVWPWAMPGRKHN